MKFARAAWAAVLLFSFVPVMQAGEHDDCGCDCCHRHSVPCEEVVKEKHVCWNVECKEIGIPGICSPFCKSCRAHWFGGKGKGCGKEHCGPCEDYQPVCGKVRTIHVLKPQSYDVEKCKFTWQVPGKGGVK